MEELEKRIQADGRVLGKDILKVDSFLNHQIDPQLMQNMGEGICSPFRQPRGDEAFND